MFAMQANEMVEGLQKKLPPTDSRLRPDLRQLERGNYDKVLPAFATVCHPHLLNTVTPSAGAFCRRTGETMP